MAEGLALNLVDKGLVTDQLVLTVGYDRENLTDPALLTRRLNLTACHVVSEARAAEIQAAGVEQLDLFTDYAARAEQQAAEKRKDAKEKHIQHAMLDIQKKYGKNAILKGMDLQEGATARERNATIGGHKA